MSTYNHYIKIKDKICIAYEGYATEYIVQLRLLRKSLEERFPGMEISFSCREQYFEYLSNDSNSIKSNAINQKFCEIGGEYGLIFPITYNASNELHPILSLIKDCKLTINKYKIKNSNSHYGIICPEGNFPNKSLDSNQVTQLKSWVQSKGFNPLVVENISIRDRINMSKTAGFVVGVECDMIYEAVESGIPTAIVPSSKYVQELYELMTEKPIILDCQKHYP